MANSKLKISKQVSSVLATSLKPDPKNFSRPPITPEQKEEWKAFCESIWANGVWGDKPLLVWKNEEKNELWVLRGRRRWTAIMEGIKKSKLPKNFLVPIVFLESDYNATYREAIYGDNDTSQRYRPEERQAIILQEWSLKEILTSKNLGGDRGGRYAPGKKSEEDSVTTMIHKAIPTWTIHQINRDIAAIRKANPNKYPDLSNEQIENYNKQILSWWGHVKSLQNIEKEKGKAIAEFLKREEKIKQEISYFAKGFPKGGPEKYVETFVKSKRPEFQALKKIKGLKEYIESE